MTEARPTAADTGVVTGWLLQLGRRLRQWRGTEPRTRVQIRCEREKRGGWWICNDVLQSGDVVYSFDYGGDLELERALLRERNARVYVFDPDPGVAERAESEGLLHEFQLYAIRLGAENRPAVAGGGPEDARTIRLATLMRVLGHRRLDLVKLNGGTVGAAIQDLVDLHVDVRQLLVSFPPTPTIEERDRVEEQVRALEGHGYRIFHITPDGHRYSFIRTDFGEP